MDSEVQRCGEPIHMVIVPTGTVLRNKKGYPALSRDHQATLLQLMEYTPRLVVSGREDGDHGPDQGIGAACVTSSTSRQAGHPG